MSKDYYKILEVSDKASDDEIKKSFKKLSLKYHPDRNPDNIEECETKYKEIVEAYEVLNDKSKKSNYDMERSGKINHHILDMFGNMFNINLNFNKGQKKFTQTLEVFVTLEDVYKGFNNSKKLKIEKECDICLGIGKKEIINCNVCNGTGQKQINTQLPFGFINQLFPCETCKQKGKIGHGDLCQTCNGTCKFNKFIMIPIKFDPGFRENDIYRYIEDNIEFIFVAKIQNHPIYIRDNNDLILNKEITLLEALIGFEFELKLLDDRIITVKNTDNVINPNSIGILKNLGIYGGNILIKFNIRFPTTIDASDIDKLKEIFINLNISKKEISNENDVYFITF